MTDPRFDIPVDRRKFVRTALASAAGMATGGAAFLAACERATEPGISPTEVRFARPVGNAVRNELHIAPTVTNPVNFALTAQETTLDLGGGKLSKVWAFNNSFPGPTIR